MGMDSYNARNSATLISASGFTAINDASHHVSTPAQASSTAQSTDNDSPKHSAFIAQYLGLGSNDLLHSHLGQLADVHVTPPSSPSEKKIPKRKRAGERHAKEIKQTAKRSRSVSNDPHMNRREHQTQMTTRNPDALCRGASFDPIQNQRASSSTTDRGLSSRIASHSCPDLALSLSSASTSRLSSHKDSSETKEPIYHATSTQDGVRSLIAPVTSMDLFQTSSEPISDVLNSLTISSPQHQVSNAPRSSNRSRIRRAPSSGHSLAAIPEEPGSSGQKTLRIAHKHDMNKNSDMEFPSLTRRESPTGMPIFHASRSLVSTTKEIFPPVKRRHELKNEAPVHVVDDDFEEFLGLDDEDFLGLETSPKATTMVFSPNDSCKPSTLYQTETMTLQGLHSSDEIVCISDDDANEWSELSDDELSAIDLTSTCGGLPQPRDSRLSLSTRLSCSTENGRNANSDVAFSSSPLSVASVLTPFARPNFPASIRDRSPLLNVTPSLTLKTCFRIGEAINIGTEYVRRASNNISDNILIELFARVSSSTRSSCSSGARQEFVFVDLWARKGPTLHGEWTTWKGSKVFEVDAANLLSDNALDTDVKTMCRTVGRIKRDRKEWKFVVLGAWECGWEDVLYARDIFHRDANV